MTDTPENYQPSTGATYAFVGAGLLLIGAFSMANADESSAFGAIGVVVLAAGFYATVAGAVARGIQLARG